MCCLCLLSRIAVQHNEFDVRAVWKSIFNRDLRFPDNTLQQGKPLWGTANVSETSTEVTKPKLTLVWILFQQMQGKFYKPWCMQSPHCALFRKLENVSREGKRGNSMLSFAAQGNYRYLPWRNLQQRLGCAEVSGKTHMILWSGTSHQVFFFLAINISDFICHT